MTDPHAPARLASEIGRAFKLSCRYEWDRRAQAFRYHFYRRGVFIGAETNAAKVVPKMEKYASVK